MQKKKNRNDLQNIEIKFRITFTNIKSGFMVLEF